MNRWRVLAPCLLMFVAGSTVVGQEQPAPAAAAPTSDERAELVLDLQGFVGVVSGLSFSPDGKLLAAAGGKEVRVWNVDRGELLATLRGQQGRNMHGNCYAVAFSPDGRELLVGVDDYSGAGSLRVYDTADWSQIKQLLPGHYTPIKRLAFTRDGQYLASAGDNGKILLWHWSTRKIAAAVAPRDASHPLYSYFEFPTTEPLLMVSESTGPSLVSTPGGQRLEPGGPVPDALRRWLLLFPRASFPFGSTPDVMTLKLEQDAWLAAGTGKKDGADQFWIGFWQGDRPEPIKLYNQHRYVVTSLALEQSNRLAASADVLGEVHVWETATGKARHVFRSLGQAVYRAALDQAAGRIAFGSTPHGNDRWTYNTYGSLEQTFDLAARRISSTAAGNYPAETPKLADRSLDPAYHQELLCLRYLKPGAAPAHYRVRAGAAPTCYSLLGPPKLGIAAPALFGDDSGGLLCYDAETGEERRDFMGHTSFVTSLSESADGRLLTTSSTDRTIRIWSLANYRPTGDLDLRQLSDVVIEVRPGTSAAKAGVKVNDRFISMDGRSVTDLFNARMAGTYDFRPGQRVRVVMERDGRRYETELVLQEAADLVEPLLNLLVVNEREWILWTPQGYYDASPGAARLIGWHVNQGPSKSAKFFSAHQFRQQLYRPDVIDLILKLGDVEAAVREASAARPGTAPVPDLRQPAAIRTLEPPAVRIVAPVEGSQTQSPRVQLVAEVQTHNELPLKEITVLVNGRPVLARGVSVEATDAAAGASPGAAPRANFSRELNLLPGLNAISVIAANAAATSQAATVNVTYQPPQSAVVRPDLYVLSIGISRYAKPEFNLRFADRDAADFAAAWKEQEGKVYNRVVSRTLLNQEATTSSILNGMDWLVKSVTQRDVAVLFVSAHGVRDPRQNYYLASHQIDLQNLRSTGLRFAEIKELLRDLPCKVLLFVDTCHSGGVTGAKAAWEDPLHDLVAEECGAVVFSSSLPREVSLEDPQWGHGAFTKALLDTFGTPASDSNGDGYLSLSEMEDQVYRRVKELTKGQQHAVVERPPTIRNFNFYYLGSK